MYIFILIFFLEILQFRLCLPSDPKLNFLINNLTASCDQKWLFKLFLLFGIVLSFYCFNKLP
jgi:hypothetical protein